MEQNYKKYETNGGRNKNLSINEYLYKIKPYLKNIIIDFQYLSPEKFN